MTRAQALLIVIGDPRVLSLDPLWRSFLNYIHNSGGWKGKPIPDWDPLAEVRDGGYAMLRRSEAETDQSNLAQRIAETIERRTRPDDLAETGDGYEAVERPWREPE